MARFTKNNKRNPLERTSSQGLVLGCPICAAKLDLLDTRDGDQAYWCHHCQSGWRAGNLPEAAHRSKDSAVPEPPVEAVTPTVEARVTGKARVANVAPERQRQRQLAALAPLTRPSGRPLPQRPSPSGAAFGARQGEAKKHLPIAPRAAAKPRVAEVIAPKRRAAPRAPASEPKAVAVKTAALPRSTPPKRKASPRAAASQPTPPAVTKPSRASPRAAEIAVSTPKTTTSKNAIKQVQKNPILENSPRNSRRAIETATPISKPVKAKRPPLEVIAAPVRAPRTSVQKRKTLEIAASAPQPKRLKRLPLEIAAPIKAPTSRAKRSRGEQPAPVISGKGPRKPTAPVLKPTSGKRQPPEVAAKPKVSAPLAAAPKPSKKTLEIAVPIKTPRVKPSRHEKPALETGKGTRKPARVAAPLPKAGTGKCQKLEAAAPKISARAAPLKPQKKTLETAAPLKASRRKKPIFEVAAVVPQKTRQRQPAPILEPTRKPRRAARAATKPNPALTKPEPTRAARVTKQPAAVAPRPKLTRSSPTRPAPTNPVQFGLFDALPAKTASRRSAK